MNLLCGIPSESPLALVSEALDRIGAPYRWFNQRHSERMEMAFEIGDRGLTGWLEIDGEGVALESVRGVYSRLMDHTRLPELKDQASDSELSLHCNALHDALVRWTEICPGRVVNRVAPMGSNSSKPYQAQLIREHGFEIPTSLITTDPSAVLEFREQQGKIIYKSISGVRSIVQTFDEKDLGRLASVRWCPTQFQAYVPGTDIRVHVVGQQVFATRIESEAVDYRYAKSQVGEAAQLTATELDDDLAQRCIDLTRGLGLVFSGIDLRITPDERVYCFEVNPCPGYSYFELNSGQQISTAVANHLAWND